MNRRKNDIHILLLLALCIFGMLIASSAWGQDYSDIPQERDKNELQEKLNTYKQTEIAGALGLTTGEEARFVEMYDQLEQIRWRHKESQMLLMQELRKELSKGDEVNIAELIDKLEIDEAHRYIEEVKIRTKIRYLIGDEEYTKFLFFETNFNRKVFDILTKRNTDEYELAKSSVAGELDSTDVFDDADNADIMGGAEAPATKK